MKKKYLRPWLKVVVIDGDDIVCTSDPIQVELKDYSTYRSSNSGRNSEGDVDWNGEGTGSDF